jgi:dTDP-4-amino-4,6-dideoxygalactose transaminase
MIKLFDPHISFRSKWYALQVLSSDYIGDGEWVKRFGREFGKKFGFQYFRAVNSGTAALEIAYDVLGIGEGDEVITPVLTCTATNIPLAKRKAKIVFADIDETLNMDPDDLRKRITKKTKAIVFVHFGGRNNNLSTIIKIAAEHKIPVVEDAAQAVGSDYWGKADITCVSFQAIKTLTTGDGGGIICKDEETYKKIYKLRWYGFDRKKFQNENGSQLEIAGYKANMNNIAAAIGLGNLRSFDKMVKHRNKLRQAYFDSGIESGIWFAEILSPNRDAVRAALKTIGVESGLHHYRNDVYELFGGKKLSLPNMNRLENQYLLLPLHQNVSVKDVNRISKMVNLYK